MTPTGTSAYPGPMSVNVTYTAPDSQSARIHDPSMVKAGSTYYLFSTHSKLYAKISTDRTNFSDDGFALPSIPPGPAPIRTPIFGRQTFLSTTASIGFTTLLQVLAPTTRR